MMLTKLRTSKADFAVALCHMGHLKAVGPTCRECSRARSRCFYMHNRDAVLAQQKSYCDSNRETVRARNRDYGNRNATSRTARVRAWRAANPERYTDHVSVHNHRRRAAKLNSPGRHTAAEWREIVARQNGRCAYCHVETKLEKDHIVPLSRGGSDLAVNLQGLCRRCNARKSNRLASSAAA